MDSMPEDENCPRPDELKEFEGRSGESGSEYYHRDEGTPAAYGSADKLQALADGYFGLNWVLALNITLALCLRIVGDLVYGTEDAKVDPSTAMSFFLFVFVVLFLAVLVASLPCNKKIGIGRDWPGYWALIASILMGLNSTLCCGAIGYFVMMLVASNEMKRYGLSSMPLGMKKKVVQARIASIRSQEAGYSRVTT
jgi:hypothetical protein